VAVPSRPRDKLGLFMRHALSWFEAVLYGIVALLLVAAAALVLIGTVEAIIEALTTEMPALEGGVLVLDRILLTLIVAEFAYTLRVVIEKHEISAEPFLFIGLIAVVRRILIVTAEFEQPQTDAQLNNLLLELGMLGVLVLGLAAAIFLIRRSSGRRATRPDTVLPPASER
jgi:uncharacterized membrane protein (DUF373 family)